MGEGPTTSDSHHAQIWGPFSFSTDLRNPVCAPLHFEAREIVMKPVIFVFCFGWTFAGLSAQKFDWQPSLGHTQVLIWPGNPPDRQPVKEPEFALSSGATFLVAGRSATEVDNVTRPTMTIYPAQGKNTGAAVVVFPGGGFSVLAIDLEGTEACDWLTAKGITCVLLKYRVPDSGPHGDTGHQKYPKAPMALEDAQRTMGLIRFRAAEYHIDPHKIGVLGFSAGGYLVADISTKFGSRVYPAVDQADKVSCRPDFAVAIYPGHLQASRDGLGLNSKISVTRQTPPTFLLQAEDDHVDNVRDSLVYYLALKNAAVPVEMHLYAQGGHAFGLRRTNLPITEWPQLVERWLRTIGMIS
jgi:acetyl esterase/lipase